MVCIHYAVFQNDMKDFKTLIDVKVNFFKIKLYFILIGNASLEIVKFINIDLLFLKQQGATFFFFFSYSFHFSHVLQWHYEEGSLFLVYSQTIWF